MNKITLSILNTVRLGKLRSGFVRQTHDHLPGSAIRGAFATAWLNGRRFTELDKPDQDDFLELFEGGVRFGPAYFGQAPRALSLLEHKYEPYAECGQGYWDRAFIREDEYPVVCPDCQQPLVESKGQVEGVNASKGRQTRTRMKDGLVDTEDGALFADDYLKPLGRTASGQIFGVPSHITQIEGAKKVRIGGSLSTKGAVSITIGAQPSEIAPTRSTLVLRLVSPAVLIDEDGFASRIPDLAQITEIVGVSAVKIERSWTRWAKVGGWHAASALPKNEELAVIGGSTFEIKFEQTPTAEQIDALINHGIGIRRHEGFGHLIVLEHPSPLWRLEARLEAHHEFSRFKSAPATLLDKMKFQDTDAEVAFKGLISTIERDFPEVADALRNLQGATVHEINKAIAEIKGTQ